MRKGGTHRGTGTDGAGGTDSGSVWARPEPGTRQSRFSRDQIAAAALAIADADGFDAVSMRRIAAMLGAGTMSLYRYVATKAELLELIDDALLAEALVPGDLPAGWRAALSAVARQTCRAYLGHPWAVQALQGRAGASSGPHGQRHAEQSLAALAGAPLSSAQKQDLLAVVDDFVFGHLLHAPGRAGGDARFELGLRLLIDGMAAGSSPTAKPPTVKR